MSGASASQIEYYARALRAPRIGDAFRRLGDQTRDSGWSHEEYLAAVLSREVSERERLRRTRRAPTPCRSRWSCH